MSISFHCERCHKVFTFYGREADILRDMLGTRFNTLRIVDDMTSCCEDRLILNGRAYQEYD